MTRKETRGRPRVENSKFSNIIHFNYNYEAYKKFEAMREEIYRRDGYKCIHCPITELEHYEKYGKVLIVHHRNFMTDDNCKSNLETICISCHTKILALKRFLHQRRVQKPLSLFFGIDPTPDQVIRAVEKSAKEKKKKLGF